MTTAGNIVEESGDRCWLIPARDIISLPWSLTGADDLSEYSSLWDANPSGPLTRPYRKVKAKNFSQLRPWCVC